MQPAKGWHWGTVRSAMKKSFTLLVLLLLGASLPAQDATSAEKLLVRTWRFTSVEEAGRPITSSKEMKKMMASIEKASLEFHADHTVVSSDAEVHDTGTWSYDAATKQLTIVDDMTHEPEVARIMVLNEQHLVLEAHDPGAPAVLIRLVPK